MSISRRAVFVGGFVLLSMTSCLDRSSDVSDSSPVSDVATNMRDISGPEEKFIFFQDGLMTGMAYCDPGSQLLDRTHCQRDLRFVPSVLVQEKLFARFGQNMESLYSRASEHQVAIDRADFRLRELIRVEPNPAQPQLRTDAEAKARDLDSVAGEIAAVEDQMTRIRAELERQDDEDLRHQLNLLRENHGQLLARRTALVREINALWQRFTTANSSIVDPTTWEVIQSQRARHVRELDQIERDLNIEIERRIAAARALNYVSDQGFVYEFINRTNSELASAIRGLHAAFAEARLIYSTFAAVPVQHQMSLDIRVTRSGELESFDCELSWSPSGICHKIRVTYFDRQHEVEVPGTRFEVNAQRRTVPELARYLGADVKGHWRISAYCNHTGVTLVTNKCQMVLK